jgi:hypothetical protein
MPVWWPGFCGTIDIVLGGWLAIRLWQARRKPNDSVQAESTRLSVSEAGSR